RRGRARRRRARERVRQSERRLLRRRRRHGRDPRASVLPGRGVTEFTLTAVGVFPEGTSVGLYPATARPPGGIGSPLSGALQTRTVTNGALTFTDLTAGAEYAAGAEVNGRWRYV